MIRSFADRDTEELSTDVKSRRFSASAGIASNWKVP